ncbi:MAG TPA: electron transfer flavoprotein subunit alpha/FixB family protein [Streptosporangiaceae bacterium]|nr:electron transfer flavoprotein subunit alpha/FixB family protein [Streptosporangiaceae bacterium]
MTVLGVLETEPGGGAADASLRALAVAGALAASAGEDLAAAWFGPVGAVDRGGLAAAGVARGWAIGPDELSGYAPLAWARALAGLASAGSSGSAAGPPGGGGPVSAVVAAATDHGNEVLAHLGAITGLPMAANCVSATRTGPGECRLVRQRWAGSLLEDAVLEAPLALLTVATDAVEAPAAGGQDDGRPADAGIGVERYEPELADGDLLVRAAESQQRRSGVSLASARVVVGGGRGVGGPEGFAALEELAGLLGAAVGVSRVVTSEGWRPHRQQVGQTGTKITPELYLACGISGAIQHMAGCQGAKTIVAINTDAGAPIVAKADYAVIGDLHEVIPALLAALRERQA